MNKIWIELEKPKSNSHADDACRLANNMLKRLCKPEDIVEGDPPRQFFYSENECCYCYGGAMGYTTLSDNGEWFNLDYFGREE